MYWVIGLLVYIACLPARQGLFSSSVYAAPLLKVVSPTEGQTIVGTEATVSFVVGNAIFGRETHLHLWLDTTDYAKKTATEITSHLDYVLSDLSDGSHAITLEAVQPDHTSFSPRVLETVQFSIQPPLPEKTSPIPEEKNALNQFIDARGWQLAGTFAGIVILGSGILIYKKSAGTVF